MRPCQPFWRERERACRRDGQHRAKLHQRTLGGICLPRSRWAAPVAATAARQTKTAVCAHAGRYTPWWEVSWCSEKANCDSRLISGAASWAPYSSCLRMRRTTVVWARARGGAR
ncbi:hypothetical protein QQY66_25145 [Streptomyces sp. DG2A-72]|uniref:hypothetical protein n=1 Tax=Streptomyces sp. DG2A-72 TaxID=3051386 RepID=UPI00265B86A5|nr:hypothetical protein [Streptomyces sp. DG2A-72]MDO0934805.1 hypothetical protein [Streptomyces sp. DG2A-72]